MLRSVIQDMVNTNTHELPDTFLSYINRHGLIWNLNMQCSLPALQAYRRTYAMPMLSI